MVVLGRAFIDENEGNDPAPTAARIKEQLKIYPYAAGGVGSSIGSYLTGRGPLGPLATPASPRFVEGTGLAFNTIPPNDFGHYEMLDALVQMEPAEALDTELAGQFAAIGIVKGEKFEPDPRLRKILDDAVAVGNAASRTLGMGAHPADEFRFYDGSTAWWSMLFVGGFEFTNPPPLITADGIQPFPNTGRPPAARTHRRSSTRATGITPAMCMRLTNVGSQYLIANVDADGDRLRRREDLPADAAQGHPGRPVLVTHPLRQPDPLDAADRPALPARRQPAVIPRPPPSPSRTAPPSSTSRPTQPDGVARGNWIQTDPDKGWFVVLRLYSPLQSFFDKTWRPGEVRTRPLTFGSSPDRAAAKNMVRSAGPA